MPTNSIEEEVACFLDTLSDCRADLRAAAMKARGRKTFYIDIVIRELENLEDIASDLLGRPD